MDTAERRRCRATREARCQERSSGALLEQMLSTALMPARVSCDIANDLIGWRIHHTEAPRGELCETAQHHSRQCGGSEVNVSRPARAAQPHPLSPKMITLSSVRRRDAMLLKSLQRFCCVGFALQALPVQELA